MKRFFITGVLAVLASVSWSFAGALVICSENFESSARAEAGQQPAAIDEKTVQDDSQQLFDFLLSGLRASREALRSGIFTAVESSVTTKRSDGSKSTHTADIYCAFDESPSLRYDYELREPLRVAYDSPHVHVGKEPFDKKEEQKELDQMRAMGRKALSKYVRSPERTIVYDGGPQVALRPPNWARQGGDMFKPIDVRALGFLNPAQYWYRLDFGTACDIFANRAYMAISEVVKETDSLYRVTFHRKTKFQTLEYKFWLDSSKGYVPMRVEFRYKDNEAHQWSNPDIAETSWEQSSGVWVPKLLRTTWNRRTRETKVKLSLNWKSVNEPVDKKLFTYESFDLKSGTEIVDER